jgi:hypothetical protein
MAITKLVSDSLGAGVGGKVLQVVTDTFTDQTTTSATLATFKTMSITKNNASNKVLIFLSTLAWTDSNGGWSYGKITVLRNGVSTFTTDATNGGESIPNFINTTTAPLWVDSATDTASITYQFQLAKGGNAVSFNLGNSHEAVNGESNYISLMEIDV